MKQILIAVVLGLVAGAGRSEPVAVGPIAVEELVCLPNEGNRAVRATLQSVPAGGSVRLYFRRLNPLGAFYYSRMRPEASGSYWSVFPKPEARRQHSLTDEWWEVLATRDWIVSEGRDRQWLESWLEERDDEAVEYYVATYDAGGDLVERSDSQLVEVLDPRECEVELSERERGWAQNLTVGETTELQNGKPLFHWLCDGVVTRVSAAGILQPDMYCRACVVASAERPGSRPGSNGRLRPEIHGRNLGDLVR